MTDKAKTNPTRYLILKKDGSSYVIFKSNVEVRGGATAAFRAVVTEPGVYVAVPQSNWTEQELSFEQPPAKLVIGGHTQPALDETLASKLEQVDESVGTDRSQQQREPEPARR